MGRPTLKKLFASSLSLRMNSNATPWKLLVPDRRLMLMVPPSPLPNSAGCKFDWTLNSAMASGLGRTGAWLLSVVLLLMPSRRKLLFWMRLPLIPIRKSW